jgi:hypothetical protein
MCEWCAFVSLFLFSIPRMCFMIDVLLLRLVVQQIECDKVMYLPMIPEVRMIFSSHVCSHMIVYCHPYLMKIYVRVCKDEKM